MITENFIKQCEKAEEIQRAWRPKDCDTFCYTKSREIGEVCSDNKKRTQREYDKNLKHQFWLPTQEQLQVMMIPILGKDFIGCIPLVLNKKLYESLYYRGMYNWGLSYEEIWLIFVMKEKYHKVWLLKEQTWKELKEE